MRRVMLWCLSVGGVFLIITAVVLLAAAAPLVAQDEGGEPEPAEEAPAAAEYVGARECRDCHRSAYSAFRATNHSLTLREVSADEDREAILADFTAGAELRTVQFPGEDAARPFTVDDIAFVLGAGRSLQAYLFERGDNDYVVFPAEWDVEKQEWIALGRAESWPDPALEFGPNCAGCHTVGLDVEDYTWEEAGVQCETCHGPGSAHVNVADEASRRPSDEEIAGIRGAIASGADPQTCGQCHSRGLAADGVHPYPVGYLPAMDLTDAGVYNLVPADDADHWWPTGHARQPNMQFNEWHTSAHAQSLEALQGAEGADDSCLACHSTDYQYTAARIARAEDGDWNGAPPEPVTLATARDGVTCTACHNPHSEAGYDYQLVTDSYTLCSSCHTQTEALSAVHHPAREMFEGLTLVAEVAGVPGAHFTAENGPDCQTCHLPAVSVGAEQERASHSLNVILPGAVVDFAGLSDGCTSCHTEYLDGAGIQQLVDDVQGDVQARLEAARAATAPDTPQWVGDALAFVDGDGSLGMHNYAYTQALLSAAEKALGLAALDTTGHAQIMTTREVLELTREAARSNTVILGLTAPMLAALAAAGLVLLLALFLLLRGRRLLAVLGLIAAFAIVAGVIILREPNRTAAITGDNANCLFCHANAAYSYTFADSSALSMRVDHERMAASVHTGPADEPFGCLDCHSADIFPHQSVSFASRGAYRVEMSGVCINCHLEDTAHYEDVLKRDILVGCSDCHTAHYVLPANQLNTAVLVRR